MPTSLPCRAERRDGLSVHDDGLIHMLVAGRDQGSLSNKAADTLRDALVNRYALSPECVPGFHVATTTGDLVTLRSTCDIDGYCFFERAALIKFLNAHLGY